MLFPLSLLFLREDGPSFWQFNLSAIEVYSLNSFIQTMWSFSSGVWVFCPPPHRGGSEMLLEHILTWSAAQPPEHQSLAAHSGRLHSFKSHQEAARTGGCKNIGFQGAKT